MRRCIGSHRYTLLIRVYTMAVLTEVLRTVISEEVNVPEHREFSGSHSSLRPDYVLVSHGTPARCAPGIARIMWARKPLGSYDDKVTLISTLFFPFACTAARRHSAVSVEKTAVTGYIRESQRSVSWSLNVGGGDVLPGWIVNSPVDATSPSPSKTWILACWPARSLGERNPPREGGRCAAR